jgi:hypothetical protein
LDFVHHLYFNKITTFRKLDLLPSSGKKKGRTETLDSCNIEEPGAIKTEEDSASEMQFCINIDSGQSPRKHFYRK